MRPVALFLSLLLSTSALAVPLEFNHQGRLHDSIGVALDGPHQLDVALYDAPAGGVVLWSEAHGSVTFDMGYYSLELGSVTPIDLAPFEANDDIWLGLSVDGGPELARVKVASVPFALVAGQVAGGTALDVTELSVGGNVIITSTGNIDYSVLDNAPSYTLDGLGCTAAGQIAQFDGLDWGCVDQAHDHDAAELVTGTLDVARLPIGTSSADVAAGDHNHNSEYLAQSELSVLDAGTLTDGGDASTLHGHPHDHAGDYLVPADLSRTATNLLTNGSFELWSRASQPDGWFVSGATLAADTTNVNAGTTSMAMTATSGQYAFATIDNYAEYAGHTVTFAIDIDDGGNGAQIEIDDGVSQSTASYSGSGYQRILVSHTVASSPVKLGVRVISGGSGVLNLDAATLAYGDHETLDYVPESWHTTRTRSLAYFEHHDEFVYGNDHSENTDWVTAHRVPKAAGTLSNAMGNFNMYIWTGAYTGGQTFFNTMAGGQRECSLSAQRRDEDQMHCEVGGPWQTNSTYGVRVDWNTWVDQTW